MRASPKPLLLLCIVPIILGLLAAPALAASPAPGWTIDSVAAPTNFSVADNAECLAEISKGQPRPLCDAYQVHFTDAGARPTDGSPVTVSDTLPQGVVVQKVELFSLPPDTAEGPDLAAEAGCGVVGGVATCVLPSAGGLSTVEPDGSLLMVINVTVDEPEVSRSLTNDAVISGGGPPEAQASKENAVSSTPAPFGPANLSFYAAGPDGARDTQAGDHPYELTTTIDLNSAIESGKELDKRISSSEDLKEVVVDLPLGFVGSALAAPECPLSQLPAEAGGSTSGCPRETVIGHIETEPVSAEQVDSPIYNLVPERGVPAEFGFIDSRGDTHVFYVHVVPTLSGYVLQATNPQIPQVILSHIVVTFYGEPAKRDQTGHANVPFFTNPSACQGGALKATIYMDSWQRPGSLNTDGTPNLEGDPNWVKLTSQSPPVTGCDELQFNPELFAQPTTSQADSPSGLEFELKLLQTEAAGTHATPALKNATVTFPEGMTVDPSAGNGLEACSAAQIGWLGGSPFNFSPDPPACPEASKIGSLELETPLISGKLEGAIYLASQDANPFGSTFATYVVVDDPVTGVVLKIAGELKANKDTGQLTAFFPENAQLPFSDLKLHLFGGPRAELATPEGCGTFTTSGDLEPWSAPDSGPNGMPFDSFQITQGCVNGFAPAFTAGSTNVQAGAYTDFVASFSRQDSDQEMGGLTLTLPPGLLANVGSVPQCTEAQIAAARASAGGCPESTQVGVVSAFAGPGPNPLFVAGKAYLTGPYNGGPYGLAIVVPAIAGPFHFGNVVVRQSLRIDQRTAQVTDVSDAFPTFVRPTGSNGQANGVPIRLKRIDVDIDRPHFTFNGTSCARLPLTGSLTSVRGESKSLETPFQVTNCSSLKFAPKLAVATAAKSSKASGASLSFKISYPANSIGSQSWFSEAKFDLPKQLPARLTTIQKACLAATFEANPAACPSASVIGKAIVHTPVLSVPLQGPVYFVSYGGAKFPEAVIVLQGSGITIVLHGETFINGKTGVTSATFRSLPDTPFESIEVTIPSGPFSEFAANLPASAKGSFCGQKLIMPTLLKASSGLEIRQNTNIAVTGCPRAKKATRAQKLAAALKLCHKKHSTAKRTRCGQQARQKYGPLKRRGKSKKK